MRSCSIMGVVIACALAQGAQEARAGEVPVDGAPIDEATDARTSVAPHTVSPTAPGVEIGEGSSADGDHASALGPFSWAFGHRSVAVGLNAFAFGDDSSAFGSNSAATAWGRRPSA
jgi:hypothetical protein